MFLDLPGGLWDPIPRACAVGPTLYKGILWGWTPPEGAQDPSEDPKYPQKGVSETPQKHLK